jgi:hypothetical protein
MAGRTKRRRLTIASLMAAVALLSLPLALVAPLARRGRPPCLSTASTARWLIERPGAASCNDCHSDVGVVDRLRAMLPATGPGPACSAARGARGSVSCASCHAG